MPQEWPFGVRSLVWPKRCATTEASLLPADVADAFVDRTPIDWAALLTRARTPSDRGVLESLRWLDLIRRPARPAASQLATHSRRSIIARLVIFLAAVQTACSFAALGLAF